jgi:2-polyprenyl-3-methyl-5-hydroxy-6-metoxy-1,4-benzoquinol methylase
MARVYAPAGSALWKELEGVEFRLEECARCRLIYQVHVPDGHLAIALYEAWINPGSTKRKEIAYDLNTPLTFLAEIAAAVRFLGGVPSKLRVLDYGMGWGSWCAVAKGLGCQVFGTELSESRRQDATARGIGIVEEEDIPGQGYDLINTEQVFEHLPDPRSAFGHLAKGLRPGGLMKISVPPSRGIRRLLKSPDWEAPKGSRRTVNPVAPLEHLNCYSRKSLEMLGLAAGLVPIRLPLRASYLPIHGRTLKEAARNALLPLARNLGMRECYIWYTKPPKSDLPAG